MDFEKRIILKKEWFLPNVYDSFMVHCNMSLGGNKVASCLFDTGKNEWFYSRFYFRHFCIFSHSF